MPHINNPKQEYIEDILELIETRSLPAREICDRLNIERTYGSKLLSHLHDNDQVYIERYCRRVGKGGSAVPQYRAGDGDDAEKPRPYTPEEKRRMEREDLDDAFRILPEPVVIARDPLVAAFFGEAA